MTRAVDADGDVLLLSVDEGVELAGRSVDALFGKAPATGPTFHDTGS